ncbi:spermidine synthase [Georgenia sp. 311]|uniref:spermidine synthase n=1 Tax=Georgenia sp. 311 TaxID=2585134 RepID=UPI0011121E89|nr:fused MFS/spermidine synthase [Georgenia sp. 311]TNC16687.1 spermidine synthase [Georgenia sp. 311]
MPERPSRRRSRRLPLPHLPAEPVQTSTGVVELLRDPGRPSAVTVFINDAESSYVDLADPSHLEFEYMQQMVAVLDEVGPPPPEPLRVVHLGGAGCALARALDAARPGSTQLVVEIDAELARLSREWFDLPRAPRLRIRVADARAALGTLAPGAWDVIVRDVFAGIVVPDHVRTVEAAAEARAALAPDGLYLVNLTDRPPLTAARTEVATLLEVFGHVAVIADPAILRGKRYGNVVLVGSTTPIATASLDRALRRLPLPVRLVAGEDVLTFAGSHRPARDVAGTAPAPA